MSQPSSSIARFRIPFPGTPGRPRFVPHCDVGAPEESASLQRPTASEPIFLSSPSSPSSRPETADPEHSPDANAPIRDSCTISVNFFLMFSQFLRIVTGVERRSFDLSKTYNSQNSGDKRNVGLHRAWCQASAVRLMRLMRLEIGYWYEARRMSRSSPELLHAPKLSIQVSNGRHTKIHYPK